MGTLSWLKAEPPEGVPTSLISRLVRYFAPVGTLSLDYGIVNISQGTRTKNAEGWGGKRRGMTVKGGE